MRWFLSKTSNQRFNNNIIIIILLLLLLLLFLLKGQAFSTFRLYNAHLFLGRPTSLIHLGLYSKPIIGILDPSILS